MSQIKMTCVDKKVNSVSGTVTFMENPEVVKTQQGEQTVSKKAFTYLSNDLEEIENFRTNKVYTITIE